MLEPSTFTDFENVSTRATGIELGHLMLMNSFKINEAFRSMCINIFVKIMFVISQSLIWLV